MIGSGPIVARSRKSLLLVAAAAFVVFAVALWWRGNDAAPGRPRASTSDAPAARGSAGSARGGPGPLAGAAVLDDSFAAQYASDGDGALATVVGTVVDILTREPVPGVDVLFSLPIGAEETVTSANDGSYTIQLGPGAYEVRAVGDHLYAPKRPLKVGRVVEPLRVDLEVMRLAVVRGRVIDGAGTPVAGATVSVSPADENVGAYDTDALLSRGVTTVAGGRFEIAVMPGMVKLAADAASGHGRIMLTGVPPAGVQDGVEIKLEAHASVAGVVRTPDGAVIAGATVHATIRVPGTRIGDRVTAETDGGGRFRFDKVLPAQVTLEARATGFGPSPPMKLYPLAGETRDDLVLALSPPLQISGRVIDASGAPVAAAKVVLERAGSRTAIPFALTPSDGTFRFVDIDGGPFALKASVVGQAQARRENLAAPADGIELVLQAHGRIRGIVTDAGGRPVRDFTVAVERFVPAGASAAARAPGSTRFASEDGRYELATLDPGSYDLLVSATGHAPALRRGIELPSGGVGDGSVQLGTAGAISGTVRSKGKVIAGARVTVLSGYAGPPVYTDEAGRFTVSGVAPGVRTVAVSHGGFNPAQLGGVVVAEGDTEVAVELEAAASASNGAGELFGIGVVVVQSDLGPQIARILKGSPAAGSRLHVGDIVNIVDGRSTEGLTLAGTLDLLRGASASRVELEVYRPGLGKRGIVIQRARIQFEGDGAAVASFGEIRAMEPQRPGHQNGELSRVWPRSTIGA